MKLPGLPHRIHILNTSYHVPVIEALSLVRDNRARQCFVNGEFLGIELGHFGPAATIQHAEVLPAAELPGVYFQAPHSDNLHKVIMDLAYSGYGPAEFA